MSRKYRDYKYTGLELKGTGNNSITPQQPPTDEKEMRKNQFFLLVILLHYPGKGIRHYFGHSVVTMAWYDKGGNCRCSFTIDKNGTSDNDTTFGNHITYQLPPITLNHGLISASPIKDKIAEIQDRPFNGLTSNCSDAATNALRELGYSIPSLGLITTPSRLVQHVQKHLSLTTAYLDVINYRPKELFGSSGKARWDDIQGKVKEIFKDILDEGGQIKVQKIQTVNWSQKAHRIADLIREHKNSRGLFSCCSFKLPTNTIKLAALLRVVRQYEHPMKNSAGEAEAQELLSQAR